MTGNYFPILTRELGLRLLRKLCEIRQFDQRIIPL